MFNKKVLLTFGLLPFIFAAKPTTENFDEKDVPYQSISLGFYNGLYYENIYAWNSTLFAILYPDVETGIVNGCVSPDNVAACMNPSGSYISAPAESSFSVKEMHLTPAFASDLVVTIQGFKEDLTIVEHTITLESKYVTERVFLPRRMGFDDLIDLKFSTNQGLPTNQAWVVIDNLVFR